MADAKRIQIGDLSAAIGEELTIYGQEVEEAIDAAAKTAMRELVNRTRATAPVGARGKFRASIASKKMPSTRGQTTYVWYVKAPAHRLTHLLVHGHATKNGGRTRSNPFLHNALDTVLPAYEEKVKEAVQNGRR